MCLVGYYETVFSREGPDTIVKIEIVLNKIFFGTRTTTKMCLFECKLNNIEKAYKKTSTFNL